MTDETNTAEAPIEAPTEEKKTKQMSFTLQEDGTIRAEFGEGVEPVQLSTLAIPEALHAAAMAEGIISRLRGYTSKLQGDARTPTALRAAVAKGAENILAGVWKIERAPGEGTEYSIEVEAAFLFRQMRAKAKGEEFTGSIQEAAESFGKLTDEEKKTLKALPRYQLALAEVKSKRAAAKAEALAKKVAEEEENAPM